MTRKPLLNMVVVSILAALTAESARSTAYRTAEEASLAFEAAWNDPKHTRFRMTPVALNAAFAAKSVPTRTTKTELWAIEMAKAAAPQLYIPHVVRAAIAGQMTRMNDDLSFLSRVSEQRSWLNPEVYVTVKEDVYILPGEQRVLFFGCVVDDRQSKLQPIFHVEHAAEGVEEDPINTWRIVHLTPCHDTQLEGVMQRLDQVTDPILRMVDIHRSLLSSCALRRNNEGL
ncbi:MAG: hypothetical protein ACK5O7_05275 [Holosporales bacterium]